MDVGLERELKWTLDAHGYQRLRSHLDEAYGPPRELAQHNRFFDTPQRHLREARLNLRIRQENADVVLTCKQAAVPMDQNGGHSHHEWERRLDPEVWDQVGRGIVELDWLDLPAHFRTVLADRPLECIGGFANLRLEYHDEFGDELCLDQTVFERTRVDYEIEIETTDLVSAARRWQQRLREWDIACTVQHHTKFARFLAVISAQR